MISNPRTELEQRKGRRQQVAKELRDTRRELKRLKQHAQDLADALALAQAVAQKTQQQLEYHISEPVTLALETVFPEQYKLHADFVLKRGQTEVELTFSEADSEEKIKPIDASGGGAVDVAAFGLRVALWSLQRSRSRSCFILDEPFKNINDPTRKLHQDAAQMVRMIADRLGVQIICVTLLPELVDVADRVFEVTKRGKVSKVEVVK